MERANAERRAQGIEMPDRKPAYGGMLVASDGSVWVGEYAVGTRAPGRWEVFAEDGVWRETVTMPLGFKPLEVKEDLVLGVLRDELGLEQVQLRRVVSRD